MTHPLTVCAQLGQTLHSWVAILVDRLRQTEVSRQSLLSQLEHATAQCQQLAMVREKALELQQQVEGMQKEVQTSVCSPQDCLLLLLHTVLVIYSVEQLLTFSKH